VRDSRPSRGETPDGGPTRSAIARRRAAGARPKWRDHRTARAYQQTAQTAVEGRDLTQPHLTSLTASRWGNLCAGFPHPTQTGHLIAEIRHHKTDSRLPGKAPANQGTSAGGTDRAIGALGCEPTRSSIPALVAASLKPISTRASVCALGHAQCGWLPLTDRETMNARRSRPCRPLLRESRCLVHRIRPPRGLAVVPVARLRSIRSNETPQRLAVAH
jgi:hypothetical protein